MKQTIKSLLLSFAAMLFVISASAQITTSSLTGKVVAGDGEAIPGAAVVAVHTPSGTQYHAIANAEGRFQINGMRAGGPYDVEVSCLGYQTTTYTGITLQLAEAYALSAKLADDTQMLSEAIVISESASKFAVEKTGAATNINNSQITALPTVSRSITDVAKLSPYGGNGMSFAGTDGRSGNFTVDGANFNNNFGLSSSLPGGGNPISVDAIEEVQVVISPFDVRQTNFIGGGVNAITKSGTNKFKGSAYVYHRNENMGGDAVEREQIAGARAASRTTTYGFTLGGPIIKNKLFFFVNFERTFSPGVVNRWRPSEDGVADADNYISRTSVADMQKVSDHLKSKYGYDPGSYDSFPANESNMKLLARIDWNITNNHHLAVRYNYTLNQGWNATNGSSSDCGQRTTYSRLSQYSMAFANSMYSMDNKVNTFSVDLNSRINDRLSNQFLATFSQLNDLRGSNSDKFPMIDILDGSGKIMPYMTAGYELFTWNNGVHNNVFTVKDDITYFIGAHKITAGLSYEYQLADNSYMRNGTGYYRYNSLDDFLTGAAPETVNLTYGYGGEESPAATVRYHKAAIYAQDDWNVTDRFKLTYGIRLETLSYSNKDVMTNNAILEACNSAALLSGYDKGLVDTGNWPSTKLQVSPRIGFNWDVLGNKSLKIRGGTGLFSGRLPLVFFTNMPTNSGMVQGTVKFTTKYKDGVASPNPYLASFAGGLITNTSDLLDKMASLDPTVRKDITPEDGALPSKIAAVKRDFKMPQVWKSSIAVDYSFPTPFPFSVTAEFTYNKTVNGVMMTDYSIKDARGFARLNGADNRHIYPTDYKYQYMVDKSGNPTADASKMAKTKDLPGMFVLSNTHKGYGHTSVFQINMQPIKGMNITAAYTHTVSKELTGMPGSDPESAFTYVPTTEGPNNAVLHNSQYVTPDRIFASATYSDRSHNHFSIFYETWRGGSNYSYMYASDLNGDGYNYDAMYIPRDASEIRFASQDDADRYFAFAKNNAYLSNHAGSYAEGYSAYNPWVHRIDLRYARDIKLSRGKKCSNILQISVDLKNALNLFNSSWGVSKTMNTSLNSGRILDVDRIDPDGVPVYKTISAVNGDTPLWIKSHGIGQCWYAQVGLKYMFN